MSENEREVRYGGVSEFDQLQARILDAVREAFAVFAVTANENGEMQTFSLVPHPENEKQRRWIEEFIETTEEGLKDLRSVIEE